MNAKSALLTLPQAARFLERGGKKPSACSVWRWCRRGCRGVKLEYLRIGKQIYVTPDAILDFGRALAAKDRDLPPAQPSTFPDLSTPAPRRRGRTPAQLERDMTQARREYESARR